MELLQIFPSMLLYTLYQPVFYATHDEHFPSESEERAAYWEGFGEQFLRCNDPQTFRQENP